jgi:hypothetical protein
MPTVKSRTKDSNHCLRRFPRTPAPRKTPQIRRPLVEVQKGGGTVDAFRAGTVIVAML